MRIIVHILEREMMRLRLMVIYGEVVALEILALPHPFMLPMIDYARLELIMFILF